MRKKSFKRLSFFFLAFIISLSSCKSSNNISDINSFKIKSTLTKYVLPTISLPIYGTINYSRTNSDGTKTYYSERLNGSMSNDYILITNPSNFAVVSGQLGWSSGVDFAGIINNTDITPIEAGASYPIDIFPPKGKIPSYSIAYAGSNYCTSSSGKVYYSGMIGGAFGSASFSINLSPLVSIDPPQATLTIVGNGLTTSDCGGSGNYALDSISIDPITIPLATIQVVQPTPTPKPTPTPSPTPTPEMCPIYSDSDVPDWL